MPTYSYKCTACGNAFDTVQSFSDSALTTCEVCGGTLRKIFSPVGVTFNGSGFYRTDSRSKPAASSGSGSGSGKSDSGSGKSDSGSGKSSGTSDSGAAKSGSSSPSSAPAGSGSKS